MSTSRPPANRTRLGYFEDFTTVPVVQGIDTIVKSATVRRADNSAELVEGLNTDIFDVALIPSTYALAINGVDVIACSALASMGASRTFMVYSNKLPTEISRVLVDVEDYGTTNLARLLFSKKLMVRPEFYRSTVELDPASYDLTGSDGYDAYLITGKNAIRVRKEQFSFAWDLTLAWYEFTRLPYIVHCWVAKRGVKLQRLDKELADLARRNETQSDNSQKLAERFSVSTTSVRAIYERAFFTEFNNTILTSLRKLGQELAVNKIQSAHPLRVYTEAAQRRHAGT